jgi:hypothetical protein
VQVADFSFSENVPSVPKSRPQEPVSNATRIVGLPLNGAEGFSLFRDIQQRNKADEESCKGTVAIFYALVLATGANSPEAMSSLKLLYTLARGPANLSLRLRFRLARENKSSMHLSTVAPSV